MEDDLRDLERKLEDLAGRRMDLPPDVVIGSLRYAIGAYDHASGHSAWRNFLVPIDRPPAKSCQPHTLLDASGVVVTGADGSRTFLLSSFVCLPQHRKLEAPVNLLATAQSDKPVFPTTSHELIDPGDILRSDVEITIRSWDAGGSPAPGVAVHWRCRVASATLIL